MGKNYSENQASGFSRHAPRPAAEEPDLCRNGIVEGLRGEQNFRPGAFGIPEVQRPDAENPVYSIPEPRGV